MSGEIEDILTGFAEAGMQSGFTFRASDENIAVLGEGERWLVSAASPDVAIDARGATLVEAFRRLAVKVAEAAA